MGARGIGAEVARRLHNMGAKLVLNAMNARSSSYWLVLSYRARATARGFQGRTARVKSCVAHADRLKPQTAPALVSG